MLPTLSVEGELSEAGAVRHVKFGHYTMWLRGSSRLFASFLSPSPSLPYSLPSLPLPLCPSLFFLLRLKYHERFEHITHCKKGRTRKNFSMHDASNLKKIVKYCQINSLIFGTKYKTGNFLLLFFLR